MKASELQDLLVTRLAKQAGGTQRRWRLVIGPIRVHDLATHPHCNWSVSPSGGAREVGEVERLVDDLLLAYPIIAAD